jgi:hypothetical protein
LKPELGNPPVRVAPAAAHIATALGVPAAFTLLRPGAELTALMHLPLEVCVARRRSLPCRQVPRGVGAPGTRPASVPEGERRSTPGIRARLGGPPPASPGPGIPRIGHGSRPSERDRGLTAVDLVGPLDEQVRPRKPAYSRGHRGAESDGWAAVGVPRARWGAGRSALRGWRASTAGAVGRPR